MVCDRACKGDEILSEAYLDNAATTKVCEESIEAAGRMMRECYGNPSSLHHMGVSSAREMNRSRQTVAELLGCEPESVCFTSGGSESNNLAIFGTAAAKARRGKKAVTTAAEHSSVAAAMRRLEELGWEVTWLKPDAGGALSVQQLVEAVDGQTSLVSVMMVNNETGAIFPVEQAARQIHQKNPQTVVHCDGVQAFGKLPLRIARTEIDLMSLSGHKICAPKGSGALYIRRGVRIRPLIYGGGQEKGLRSGTESLPMIAALGAACARLQGQIPAFYRRTAELNLYLRRKLEEIEEVCINSPENASPYILNFSVLGWRAETMLHFLESRQVYVSSGSACSKGATSPVLTAMGLSRKAVDGALRVSMIYDTQKEELDQLVLALKDGIMTVAH